MASGLYSPAEGSDPPLRRQLLDNGMPADVAQPLLQRWHRQERHRVEQKVRSWRVEAAQHNAPGAERVVDDPTP
eukprot:5301405-Alexandrium_andersonii.AAC.1